MNRLHLMQSPREIANRAPPSASRAAAAELVEPLQRHARGYYVHLRIRAKKDATYSHTPDAARSLVFQSAKKNTLKERLFL